MAKDPAVLFYTSDFISGTITMTDEQRGQYIMLLCLQHQKGFLTEKDMLMICKTYDEDIWCKFINDNGKYYNERMKTESEKRKKYSESRSNNRTKKELTPINNKKISKTYDKHMENENENINKDINKKEIKKVIVPTFEEFEKYVLETEKDIEPSALRNKYNSWVENGWKDGHDKKIVNWKSKILNTISYLPKTTKNGTIHRQSETRINPELNPNAYWQNEKDKKGSN
jgi:hypothetical protein